MKQVIAAILITFSINAAMSQGDKCGTIMPDEMKTWLADFQKNELQNYQVRSGLTFIPIKFHIVGDDSGVGYYSKQDLFRTLCELNVQFAPLNFYFYNWGNIVFINNSDYYVGDRHGQMMFIYNASNAVNIYITGPIPGLCGYFTGGGDAVVLVKGCLGAGNTTFAHELGHYFSMPHTFSGWEGSNDCKPGETISQNPNCPDTIPYYAANAELVDGSNCAFSGDGFCDTRADYFYWSRFGCSFGPQYNDPNGQPLNPDETLYMSYFFDACTNRFSSDQNTSMNAFLQSNRTDLISSGFIPNMDMLPPVTLTSPANGATGIPSNKVVLEWDAVPNAIEYHLILKRNQPNVTIIDVITINTKYTAGLKFDLEDYVWTVKALSSGNTCSPASNESSFQTLPITGIADIDNANDFKLYPNPVVSSEPLGVLVTNSSSAPGLIQILNTKGQLVFETSAQLIKGYNKVELPALRTGIYLFNLVQGDVIFRERFFVIDH